MAIVFHDLVVLAETREQFLKRYASDIKRGLTSKPKTLPQEYIWDAKGSEIFCRLMEVEEYYVTKCQLEIVHAHSKEIVGLMEECFNLVDLGAGSGVKSMALLEACENKHQVNYVPIDISKGSNEQLVKDLKDRLPWVDATILTGTYEVCLSFLSKTFYEQSLLCLFGSNIGSYSRSEAANFLRLIRQSMKQKDLLLITFDLRKDYKIIEPVYDDSKGISRSFSMNTLHRINAELKGDFNPGKFFFHSYFDALEGCVRFTLISSEEQEATIGLTGDKVHLDPFEPIVLGEAHKYCHKEIEALAKQCGFEIKHNFHDSRKYTVASVWKRASE